jgi:hypothetical protein
MNPFTGPFPSDAAHLIPSVSMPRRNQYRGRRSPSPEPQRHDHKTAALLATAGGIVLGTGAIIASMSHKYRNQDDQITEWSPRTPKQVAWEDDRRRLQYQSHRKEKAKDRKSSSRIPTSMSANMYQTGRDSLNADLKL